MTEQNFEKNDRNLFERAIPLNVLWRVLPSENDRMSTNSFIEAERYPRDGESSKHHGQVFYLPRTEGTNQVALYRWKKNGVHLDSPSPCDVSGCVQEGIHGYPWTLDENGNSNGPPGTRSIHGRIFRVYNDTTGDYATITKSSSLSNYDDDRDFGLCAFYRAHPNSEKKEIGNGTLRIVSNGAAGGQVWNWFWNEKQFLNVDDYGRGIQSSLSIQISAEDDNRVLPTEGGDSTGIALEYFTHGSPLIHLHNESALKQISRCTPLVWGRRGNRERYGGGEHNPVVISDLILGKNMILSPPEISQRWRSQVVRYETFLFAPFDILPRAGIEVPTGYLKNEFSDCYFFDGSTLNFENIANPGEKGVSRYPDVAGGAICSTSAGDFAQGVYSTRENGVFRYSLFKKANIVKWAAASYAGADERAPTAPPHFRGKHLFKSYILTGKLEDVKQMMIEMFESGVR